MIVDILKQLNWVDFCVVIILFRIIYVAFNSTFFAELFKLLGIVLAIYLAMHYYTALADFIRQRVPVTGEKVPLRFLDFLCFTQLAGAGYLMFVVVRVTTTKYVKMEMVSTINRWGAGLLGFGRSVLTVGLVIFMFSISDVAYLKKSTVESYSGPRLHRVAPVLYGSLWYGFMSKFMTREKFNDMVNQAEQAP